MTDESLASRFEAALRKGKPEPALLEFARELKAEGMSQRAMYDAFDIFRAKHESDADETVYYAILDTMDFIAGWCAPDVKLFDTNLEV
jgi:hypothetical protein